MIDYKNGCILIKYLNKRNILVKSIVVDSETGEILYSEPSKNGVRSPTIKSVFDGIKSGKYKGCFKHNYIE